MATTTYQFSLPLTCEGIPPTTSTDFWQYSKMEKVKEEDRFELIENTSTGATFFLNKEISYGDFLIIVFLMLFLIFGIVRFFINFIMKKFYDN